MFVPRRFAFSLFGILSLGLAGCASSSSSSTASVLPEVAIAPLCEYTPFGPLDPYRVPYWKKHLKDSAADFSFVLELDGPVGAGGATIHYDLAGDAVAGVHFMNLSPNPLVLPAGATGAEVSVDLIPSGEFYHERLLALELGAVTGATLHAKSHRAELWIRPSVDPPT
ncbi:MAG: hypothetical protein KDB61_02225, partial [Planctomycetes bacterium]|nr:hypothetical protein [Planctomycetota bacterium]